MENKRVCSMCKEEVIFSSFKPSLIQKFGGYCKKCRTIYNKNWGIKNREKNLKRALVWVQKKRNLILQNYGAICACCGEKTRDFLAIDHVNNDGYIERKKYGGTKGVYIQIIKNGFPDTYQILCHNCNMAKAYYGKCPHKKIRIYS